jgi:hypothetical protein
MPLATALAVGLGLISVGEILHSQRTPHAVSVNTTNPAAAVETAPPGPISVRPAPPIAAAPPVAEPLNKPETRRVVRETPAGPRGARSRGKRSFFSRFFHTRVAIHAVPL